MPVVLDSSAALTWCIPGQASEPSKELFLRVQSDGAIVPSIWEVGMANILGLKQRSGFLSQDDLEASTRLLALLPVAIDEGSKSISNSLLLRSMKRFRLVVYDAIYLELAERLRLPIATFDKEMIEAARVHGIPLGIRI